MDLSIVIPVYNIYPEKMERCFKSLSSLGGISLEVILVDDGSTEENGAFCRNYAERYDYFRYIHQENKGVSAARNTGIRHATGDYIMFVDADDEVIGGALDPQYLQNNWDILFFDFELHEGLYHRTQNVFMHSKAGELLKKDCVQVACCNGLNPVWAKVYRRKMLTECQILFDETMVSAEDAKFSFLAIQSARTMCYIPMPIYRYYHSYDSGRNRLKRYERKLQENAVQLYTLREETLERYGMQWGMTPREQRNAKIAAAEMLIRFLFEIEGSLLLLNRCLPKNTIIELAIWEVFKDYGKTFPLIVQIKCFLLRHHWKMVIKAHAFLRMRYVQMRK